MSLIKIKDMIKYAKLSSVSISVNSVYINCFFFSALSFAHKKNKKQSFQNNCMHKCEYKIDASDAELP